MTPRKKVVKSFSDNKVNFDKNSEVVNFDLNHWF